MAGSISLILEMKEEGGLGRKNGEKRSPATSSMVAVGARLAKRVGWGGKMLRNYYQCGGAW
jgi:hypothetical protein